MFIYTFTRIEIYGICPSKREKYVLGSAKEKKKTI